MPLVDKIYVQIASHINRLDTLCLREWSLVVLDDKSYKESFEVTAKTRGICICCLGV